MLQMIDTFKYNTEGFPYGPEGARRQAWHCSGHWGVHAEIPFPSGIDPGPRVDECGNEYFYWCTKKFATDKLLLEIKKYF